MVQADVLGGVKYFVKKRDDLGDYIVPGSLVGPLTFNNIDARIGNGINVNHHLISSA